MINMNEPVGQTPLDTKPGVDRAADRPDRRSAQGDGPCAPMRPNTGKSGNRSMDSWCSRRSPRAGSMRSTRKPPKRRPACASCSRIENAPKQGPKIASSNPQLGGPTIDHHGQPIALVVADTFEQARAAAYLVKPDYVAEKGRFDMGSNLAKAFKPKRSNGNPPDTQRRAISTAALKARAGQGRRDLHHAAADPCHDGAARHDRGLERRRGHALHRQPDAAARHRDAGRHAADPEGEDPARQPLRRWRVRGQAPGRGRRHPGGTGGQDDRQARSRWC